MFPPHGDCRTASTHRFGNMPHWKRLAEEEDVYFADHPLFQADQHALDERFVVPESSGGSGLWDRPARDSVCPARGSR